MDTTKNTLKVAVVQATPYLYDVEATLNKTIKIIEKAKSHNVDLVVFPQAFLPGLPIDIEPTLEITNEKIREYYKNSVTEDSEIIEKLLSHTNDITVSIGISEFDKDMNKMYNSNFILKNGSLEYIHRSNLLIGVEKNVWNPSLQAPHYGIFIDETNDYIASILINHENFNPKDRSGIYTKKADIYIAPNSQDNYKWQEAIKFIANEGKQFVLSSTQYINTEDYKLEGGSAIINPFGDYVVGPVYGKEAILMAVIDLEQISISRIDFNPIDYI